MNNQTENYAIEETKDNLKIAKVLIGDKWIYIGSKYNMNREIEKFLDKFVDVIKESVLIVLGFGAGEHIKALREKYSENIIIVYEPNNILKEFVESQKWAYEDEKIKIVYNTKELRSIISEYINEINYKVVKSESFANYSKIYINENVSFLKETKEGMLNALMDKNTKITFNKRWFETLMNTLPYSVNGIPADLFEGKLKDKPVVIVSAGPSLEKNIMELKKFKDQVFIMSSGRTLRPLIENGIQPDLIVVLDPGNAAYTQCKDYLDDAKGVPLLYYEGTNDEVVMNHKGLKLFLGYNKIFEVMLDRRMKPLEMGGSVVHTMFSYSLMLGCNPIIFIGQDFAYTGDKYHASIADNKYNADMFEDVKSDKDIYVDDINGGKVRTSLVLNNYRRSLEIMLSKYLGKTYINATEGGARIENTIEMTLNDALNQYRIDDIPKLTKIAESIKINNQKMKKNVVDYMVKAKRVGNEIIVKCNEEEKYLQKYQKILKKGNENELYSLSRKLDKLDKTIKKKFTSVELIHTLLYPTLISVLQAEKQEKKEEELLEDNINFYKSIKECLKYSLKDINDFIKKQQ